MKKIEQQHNSPPFLKRVYNGLLHPSIRFYLILMNLILLCLLFPSISFLFLSDEEKFRDSQLNRTITQMHDSLRSRGASLARSMALSSSQAIAGYDFTFLNIMINQVVTDDPEIAYCIVMDSNRLIVTHSDPSKIGGVLRSPIDFKVEALINEQFPSTITETDQSESIKFFEYEPESNTNGKPIMEAIAPLYNGNQRWGALRLGYSLDKLNNEIAGAKKEWNTKMDQFKLYMISITAIFFSIGVLIAAFFTRSFVRSVKLLSDGVNKISEGNLDYKISQKGLVCSEVMDLSAGFNVMTDKLRSSYKQLDEYSRSLKHKVEERTRELQVAQSNLMRQAHEAGMAEMAVGILHNIGNAITPAKVSASLLRQKLNNSPIRNHLKEIMGQVEDILEEAAPDNNEKERISELIKLLPESAEEEYENFSRDVDQIREKHAHIEGIINLQMRYARLFGDHEEVDLNRITDDALKMLDDSIRKRAVVVHKEMQQVPKVKIEQAKIIQIVINLIKNAYEAMDNSDTKKREITIKTWHEPGPPEYAVFSVKDNGIGFTSEEREKMFMFGYSSKEKGSGFGLHSCANYLIANNGLISAHSDGKGKGAEFIIKLAI